MAINRAEGLAKVLTNPEFNTENFVENISKGGEDDLLDMKQEIQVLNDSTAQALKKNVYKNYSQFIETAKEISILEHEMYQLSHMLTEQRTIMSAMLECSLTSDKAMLEPTAVEEVPNPEEETRRNLAFLLEKVEGCSSITEVPGRQLIHNGDLIELDPETYTHLQRVHAFLLNDSLMIASWLPNRRGLVRYRFQGLYELDNLAMVNVRDVGAVKNAFKILMFPDTRMYQCESAKAKRQWLDILEETKKKKANKDKQRRESSVRLLEQAVSPSPTATHIPEPLPLSVTMEPDILSADWLQELPEDLDMCVAQRDFEGAVDLVEKVNEYLNDCNKTPEVKEYRARIDYRVKQLTEGLVGELQVSPERLIRGGPRAARRAVTQLIRLGKSAQACHLFLKDRSGIIKYNIRQLKFEGATTLYINRLCEVFFSRLMETGREFTKAFPRHYGCYSAFVMWARNELESFVAIVKRQVFGSKANTSTIVECVTVVRDHCTKLTEIGLDLCFVVDNLIVADMEKMITDSQTQFLDAFKYRCSMESVELRNPLASICQYLGAWMESTDIKDDNWRPMNHISADMCDSFVVAMADVGLKCIGDFVYDGCFIGLTMNSAMFAKSLVTLVGDLLKCQLPELLPLIIDGIVNIYSFEVAHIEASLKLEQFSKDHEFILKNAQFILDILVVKIKELFLQQSLVIHKDITRLSIELSRLKSIANTT